MDILYAFIIISLLPIYTRAHMQMSNPYPLNSPLNPATPEYLKDYSYTSPLLSDGSNYPCKGYQIQSTSYATTATYTAGSMYSMSVTGNTTHGGGSCQLSLSYDNGQTFKVIESMIGGCPISKAYNFTVPSFAPPSESALFAWSWFNEIGNREMYMNCARVKIQEPASGRHRRAQHKRQSSMSSLPDLFVCNVNNGCTTIEQQDVQFPDPGSNVVYSSDDSTYPPSPGIGFTSIGNAPNSTASNTTTPSTTPTLSPYTNVTKSTYSLLLPNTSASTFTINSASTVVLTDFVPVATIIGRAQPSSSLLQQVVNITNTTLLTSTPSSISSSNTTLFSSAAITALTSPTSSVVPPTASSMPVIFANTTSVFPPSLTSTAQLPAVTNTTSVLIMSQLSTSQLPTFTNTTSVLTISLTSSSQPPTFSNSMSSLPSSSTTLPVPNTIIATLVSSSLIASAATTLLARPCTPGAFACNSASTFSQCVAGVGGTSSYAYLGPVAAGMQCSNGQIIRQNEGPCTPSGQLFCNGEYAFYLCDQGGLINMGPVAPGTACLDGVIVYPPSR